MIILFTNVGRRTYFIKFILDLLKDNYPIQVHVSDCKDYSSALNVSNKIQKHILPPVLLNQDHYLKCLIRLVKKNGINAIIPLSDFDIFILAKNRIIFNQMQCKVVVSNFNVIEICQNKILTYKRCNEEKMSFNL